MEKIAVLMSTYNGEKYLVEQIESILSQKCEMQIELIVRDDGSKDNTINILKSYEGKLSWYRAKNLGPGYSFLQLILDNPGYNYYAFADQDDIWEVNKIQKGIDILKDYTSIAMYCSNATLCDMNMKNLGRNVHRTMKFFNAERACFGLCCAQGCTCIINARFAELLQKNKLPSEIILHDSYLTCLCYAVGGIIYADEESYIKYRMHGNNIGGLKTRSQASLFEMIRKRMIYITSKPKVSIVNQLNLIKNNYSSCISIEQMNLLVLIVNSKKSLWKRFFCLFNLNLRDESINLSICNYFKIILSNY